MRKWKPEASKWLAQDITAGSQLITGEVRLLSAPRYGCVTLGRAQEKLEFINWQIHQVYHNGLSSLCQGHDFSSVTQGLNGATGMCRIKLNVILLVYELWHCQTGITLKAENSVSPNKSVTAKVSTKELKLSIKYQIEALLELDKRWQNIILR